MPKSGSGRVVSASNLLSNVVNQNRGGVLAEPFPWTVIQGVILVLVIINSQLENIKMDFPTQTTQLDP